MKTKAAKKRKNEYSKGRQRFHRCVFSAIRFLLRPFFVRKYSLTYQRIPKIDGPFLVFANHNLNLDPALVGIASKRQLYFVAGEQVFHAGAASKLLRFFFAPISRPKGAGAVSTVLAVKRLLATGAGVCIFIEGNRSWDGVTGEFPEGSAYLAKSSRAHLVTLKLQGGYFTSPRWSKSSRRGKMRLLVEGVYTPEELESMTLQELECRIKEDLREDAYFTQETEKEEYTGKDLAEWMECLFFACPACNGTGCMESDGDRFFCRSCGAEMKYDTYGRLSGGRFETVTQYAKWQWEQGRELLSRGEYGFLRDGDAILWEVGADHSQTEASRGAISFDSKALRIGDTVFETAEIGGMQVFYRNSIALTCKKQYYTITFASPRANAIKYEKAYEFFSKQNSVLTTEDHRDIIKA